MNFPEHPALYRLSVEEYDRMAELGVFDEDLRVELIDGLIVEKLPNTPPHAFAISFLTNFFIQRDGGGEEGRWVTLCQMPVRLPEQHSEPEPDVALVRSPLNAYRRQHPGATDVFLAVEVAEGSLRIDRGVKLALYARAGIPEYWIVNFPDTILEIYRDPDPEVGRYRVSQTLRSGETCAPAAFPDVGLNVSELFD